LRLVVGVALAGALMAGLLGCSTGSVSGQQPAKTPAAPTSPAAPTATPASPPTTIYASLNTASDSTLVALQAQGGQERWHQPIPLVETITQGGGMVYVGTSDGRVLAYRASDGTPLWHYQDNGPAIEQLAFAQGVLYVRLARLGLLALGSDGHLLWQTSIAGDVYQVQGGLVYLDSLFVLNASDGSVRWQAQHLTAADCACTLLSIVGQHAYAMEEQVQPPVSSVLHALDASNYAQRWTFPRQQSLSLNFIGADQQSVYVVSSENTDTLYALNASDGSVRWQQPTQESGDLRGVLAQGAVYLGGDSGMAYAFDASTGKPLWHAQMTSDEQVQNNAGAISLVADGVVLYRYNGDFFVLNTSDGSLAWHNPQIEGFHLLNLGATLVADGMETGTGAALILNFKGNDGTVFWRYKASNVYVGALTDG
jgi:outer membrane protein assembly factor BamB